MRRLITQWLTASVCSVGLLAGADALRLSADEPAPEKAESSEQRVITARVVAAAQGKYWIGVQAEAADEILREHLKLESGLVVNDVIPESPAAKAGVERHDIVLRFGETAVSSVEDLVNAVEKNQDAEVELRLLRKGEEKTLKIKPSERPADGTELRVPLRIDVNSLERAITDKDGNVVRFRTFGPGFVTDQLNVLVAGEQAFPNDLELTLKKEGSAPAKITIKRKEDTWETTEDKLQELPGDVRHSVELYLHRGPHPLINSGTPRVRAFTYTVPPGQDAEAHQRALKAYAEAARDGVPRATRVEVERGIRTLVPADSSEQSKAIDELRKSVDELRQQVEALKASKERAKD